MNSVGDPKFPDTHWTMVMRASSSKYEEAREALEKLCLSYWYPLNAYARRQGVGVECPSEIALQKGFSSLWVFSVVGWFFN